MSTKSVTTAVARLRRQQEARAEAERREAEERQAVLLALGEVLEAAATSPRSKWHAFRERPLADLLVAVGLVAEGGDESEGDDEAPADGTDVAEDGDSAAPDQPHGEPWG